MEGTIETLRPTFGFIRGRDGVSRFFIPSALQLTQRISWDDLREGMVVSFDHIDHPKGPRAIGVLLLNNRQSTVDLDEGDE